MAKKKTVKKKKTKKKAVVKKPEIKRQKEGVKPLLFNGLLIVVLIVFVAVSAATVRFFVSGGDDKPFFLIEKNTFVTGIDVRELEEMYGDKYKDYLHKFENLNSYRDIPRLSFEEAAALYVSGKALFIDARSEREYNSSRITGAIPIPTNKTGEYIPELENKLKGKILITYCHGIGCRLSDRVSRELFQHGHKKNGIFFGGWNKWKEHNYPITHAKEGG